MIKASSPAARRFLLFVAFGFFWLSTTNLLWAEQTVLLFNQHSSNSFAVTLNGAPTGVTNSSSAGVVEFTTNAVAGDMVGVSATGTAVAPGVPTALGVTGDDLGCAHATWAANPETDVTGYRLFYGNESVAGGSAAAYADSIDVAAATYRDVCGLVAGTYYFAVRAFNSAGLLSGVSNEVSASVSTGNAQPPLPPLFVTATENGAGCLSVSWLPTGDPSVTGYRVDYGLRSVEGGDTNQYDNSIDVGSDLQFQICGLSSATYYVAVRAKNYIELVSGFSAEQVVQLTSTPVAITSFSAVEENYAVLLRWKLWADEGLRAIEVLRADGGAGALAVPIGARLDPSVDHFIDDTVKPGNTYSYRITVVAESGELTSSFAVQVRTPALALELEQNTPNPFNPTTSIAYVLPEAARVRLDVFDIRGALVATLHDGVVAAGRWSVWWDGTNRLGNTVAAGTYFCRLRTAAGVLTRKMILVK